MQEELSRRGIGPPCFDLFDENAAYRLRDDLFRRMRTERAVGRCHPRQRLVAMCLTAAMPRGHRGVPSIADQSHDPPAVHEKSRGRPRSLVIEAVGPAPRECRWVVPYG